MLTKLIIVLVFVSGLISGCGLAGQRYQSKPPEPSFDEILSNWVGKRADKLILSVGVPHRRHELSDGSLLIEYDFSRIRQTPTSSYSYPTSGTQEIHNSGVWKNGKYQGGGYYTTPPSYSTQTYGGQTIKKECIIRFLIISDIIREYKYNGCTN